MDRKTKLARKRQARPIYMVVEKLVRPSTGEVVGALVPANLIDKRLMRERKFHVNREVRAELKQPRNAAFHRLAHALGHLLVDHVESFRSLTAHDALKRVQREAGVCCEQQMVDMGTIKFGEITVPVGEVPVTVARSIAFDEMDEGEFGELFNGITDYVDQHYQSAMTESIRAEYLLMVQGEAA